MCCNKELNRLMENVFNEFYNNNSNLCNLHKITTNIHVNFKLLIKK